MSDQELKNKYGEVTRNLSDLIEKMDYKASLLKLETGSSWQNFKAGAHKLRERFRHDLFETREDMQAARVQGHLAWMEAREEWDEFKDHMDDALQVLHGKKKNLDEVRLQAHLGKMEMKDRFAEKRKDWEVHYEQKVKPTLKEGLEKVSEDIEKIREKLGKEDKSE